MTAGYVLAALIAGIVWGYSTGVRVARSRPEVLPHQHTWGPWEKAHEVTASTSFRAEVALVQLRHCLDDECRETEINRIHIVSAGS